jgi:hypothetical protein
LKELLLLERNILLMLRQQLIGEKIRMGIIPMQVSNLGLLISELFFLIHDKMVNRCLQKIFDGICILVKKLIVRMILLKQLKNLERFL